MTLSRIRRAPEPDLRAELERWYGLGKHVESLLANGPKPKSPADERALRRDAERMIRIAKEVLEVLEDDDAEEDGR